MPYCYSILHKEDFSLSINFAVYLHSLLLQLLIR